MDRKDLIHRYLEADTTIAQEQELAAQDPDIARLAQALAPAAPQALPEAGEEFDRIVREARRRTVRRWSLAASGFAAVLAAVLLLTRKPAVPEPAGPDTLELIRQMQFISGLDPADADDYEFQSLGDGFLMTARFEDGSTASFLLTPLDGGQSFDLVALNPQKDPR